MEVNSFLLLLIILFPFLLFFFTNKRKPRTLRLKLPPGPYAWPIFGNIFNMELKNPHIFLNKLAESLGPIMSLWLGAKLVVIASTPEAAREIYKFHDREISGRLVLTASLRLPSLRNSTIAMAGVCNEDWRFMRAISKSELFSFHALEATSSVRMDKVKQMLQLLSSKEGAIVRIEHIMFATVINTFSMAMASKDLINNFENIQETYSLVRKFIEIGVPTLSDLYPKLGWLDIGGKRKARNFIEVCTAFWSNMLREKRSRGCSSDSDDRRADFVDTLIKNDWNDNQIVNLLTEFIVSAESMTTTTEWLLSELTRNEEILSKLQSELAEAIKKGGVLRESNLAKLPYLQACIKETFRLYPPVPLLVPRVAMESCKVMKYDVPKDSVVIVNAYALGRDPKTWVDPLIFRPERFLGVDVDVKGTNYELLPFGAGRRMCAGYPWALKQIQLLVASFVLSFEWSMPKKMDSRNLDMTDEFRITLRKEKPLFLIPRKIKDLVIE